jgi:hypothetical protein
LKTQYVLIDSMATAIVSGDPILIRIPDHVHLKYNKGMTNWIERKNCAGRLVEMALPDLAYTVYTLLLEIL